ITSIALTFWLNPDGNFFAVLFTALPLTYIIRGVHLEGLLLLPGTVFYLALILIIGLQNYLLSALIGLVVSLLAHTRDTAGLVASLLSTLTCVLSVSFMMIGFLSISAFMPSAPRDPLVVQLVALVTLTLILVAVNEFGIRALLSYAVRHLGD